MNRRKSGALMASVVIHAAFVAVALTFVAVKVYIKPEQTFDAMEVNRPKMKLRKLQVPVKQQKKTQAPKLRKTIVTKTKTNIDIKMPEIVGIKGGTGYGAGGGLGGLGFGFDLDLFGSSKSRGEGNEFIGHFYDLKQTPQGKPTAIGKLIENNSVGEARVLCAQEINKFIRSGMRESQLRDFFIAPKQKYATSFNMPPMSASEAPKAFGVDDQVKPSFWLCLYRGQITAPVAGKYRLWGLGDDVLAVRVNKHLVLDACWPESEGKLSNWKSSDDNNRVFPINQNASTPVLVDGLAGVLQKIAQRLRSGEGLANLSKEYELSYSTVANRLVVGDWFSLEAGQRIDMEVLIGEIPGGLFSCRLLIEQQGNDEYKIVQSDAGKRKVLPLFKTIPVNEKLVPQMKANPNEMTLEGPVFGVVKNAK